jgi:hypothetical protein
VLALGFDACHALPRDKGAVGVNSYLGDSGRQIDLHTRVSILPKGEQWLSGGASLYTVRGCHLFRTCKADRTWMDVDRLVSVSYKGATRVLWLYGRFAIFHLVLQKAHSSAIALGGADEWACVGFRQKSVLLTDTVFIQHYTSMDTDSKKITILVPAKIVAAMKRVAEQERRSMNQEMIRAFEEHLQRQHPKKGD